MGHDDGVHEIVDGTYDSGLLHGRPIDEVGGRTAAWGVRPPVLLSARRGPDRCP